VLLEAVLKSNEFEPILTLLLPLVFDTKELYPIATLLLPVVLGFNAPLPKAVLLVPVLFTAKAIENLTAVLFFARTQFLNAW
jgi:hypothetical protein